MSYNTLKIAETELEKRIACLYRVSTTKQIDDNEIPMQKTACHKFINKQYGWGLVKEYFEMGVSGFSQSVASRDEMQKIIRDAKQRKFDILLVFTSDRLCRIATEYSATIEELSDYIEVWATDKGSLTVRTNADKITTYIDGWQNESESKKISTRVTEKHIQMTEEGIFRGGDAPFGYKLVLSGRFNTRDKKQRKELYDIVIDENEAEAVKLMYQLAYERGYGQNRITDYLNYETEYKTRSGETWRSSTISYILKNPIYKGLPAFGKKTCKKNKQIRQNENEWVLPAKKVDSLEIIPEYVWDKVRDLRKSRDNSDGNKNENVLHFPNKGKLLFVGFIKCGYCGSPLVTTTHDKTYKTREGIIHTKRSLKYRCSGKQSSNKKCEGATTYSQNKIEEPIIQYVKDYLADLRRYSFEQDFAKDKQSIAKKYNKELAKLENQQTERYKDIRTYEDSIPKVIRGEIQGLTPELMGLLLQRANDELADIKKKMKVIEEKIDFIEAEVNDIAALQKALPSWDDTFESADQDRKKIMISQVIKGIRVFRDRFEVDVKIHIEQFANSVKGACNMRAWKI